MTCFLDNMWQFRYKWVDDQFLLTLSFEIKALHHLVGQCGSKEEKVSIGHGCYLQTLWVWTLSLSQFFDVHLPVFNWASLMEPCPHPSWSKRLSSSGSFLSIRQWKRHPWTSDNGRLHFSLVLFVVNHKLGGSSLSKRDSHVGFAMTALCLYCWRIL